MKKEPLRAMDKAINLGKLMGSWYVLAHVPVFIEKNAYNAVETYKWEPEHQWFSVKYRFNEGAPDGKLSESEQRGYVHNDKTFTDLRVSPRLPLIGYTPIRMPYIICDLADDHSSVIVGYPSRSYLWIMARKPCLPEAEYAELVAKAEAMGYDPKLIRKVPQDASGRTFPVPTEPAP